MQTALLMGGFWSIQKIPPISLHLLSLTILYQQPMKIDKKLVYHIPSIQILDLLVGTYFRYKIGTTADIDILFLFFSTAGTPEENLEAAAAADPILLLDQEQINRLENVLRSEEAKDILGDVLSNAGNSFL